PTAPQPRQCPFRTITLPISSTTDNLLHNIDLGDNRAHPRPLSETPQTHRRRCRCIRLRTGRHRDNRNVGIQHHETVRDHREAPLRSLQRRRGRLLCPRHQRSGQPGLPPARQETHGLWHHAAKDHPPSVRDPLGLSGRLRYRHAKRHAVPSHHGRHLSVGRQPPSLRDPTHQQRLQGLSTGDKGRCGIRRDRTAGKGASRRKGEGQGEGHQTHKDRPVAERCGRNPLLFQQPDQTHPRGHGHTTGRPEGIHRPDVLGNARERSPALDGPPSSRRPSRNRPDQQSRRRRSQKVEPSRTVTFRRVRRLRTLPVVRSQSLVHPGHPVENRQSPRKVGRGSHGPARGGYGRGGGDGCGSSVQRRDEGSGAGHHRGCVGGTGRREAHGRGRGGGGTGSWNVGGRHLARERGTRGIVGGDAVRQVRRAGSRQAIQPGSRHGRGSWRHRSRRSSH
ncbi:hypothetical protein HKX48_002605, partial [Thoreauomyces humboldtii]